MLISKQVELRLQLGIMTEQKLKLEHLLWAAGGLFTGAWWVKNQHDQAKKSRAEKDDPDGVEEVCNTIAPILDEWEPEQFRTEDDYVEDLFNYLVEETEETDYEIEIWPSTPEGKPDILIDDRLAIEVKVNLSKAERDRLIGQTAAYSREWVTWIVLIDTPKSRVGALERLLAAKDLQHILVFDFS
jgi:hypothetical protein